MANDSTSSDRDQDRARDFDLEVKQFANVEIVSVLAIDTAKRGARTPDYNLDDASETDVLELEFQSGVKEWVSVGQMRDDLGQARAAEATGLRIPAVLPRRVGARRGVSDWVLKGLKLLRLDPVDPAADLAVDAIISKFETKLVPKPGLYRISSTLEPSEVAPVSKLESAEPLLIFLHGTASNTTGSFGRLAFPDQTQLTPTPEWEQIEKRYRGRIFGLEHRTISINPIQNALDLSLQLPERSRVHLVSHSRGGLVGELLSIDQMPESAFAPFLKSGRDAEVELLRELRSLLLRKKFEIERFVRVACPARGTLLASERLDRYLSLILNVLGQIPVLRQSLIYSFLKATTFEVARRRTRPDELPGLEAMMPRSLLISLLNRPDFSSHADLAVISGDIEGEGLTGSLKVFATDLFFREDHDLVVNTASMYGGLKRKDGARFFFDRGGDVNHFSYFANFRTRSHLFDWLSGNKQTAFEEIKERSRESKQQATRRSARSTAGAVVFLLPDVMATHLKAGRTRVWLDLAAIARGDFQRLALTPRDASSIDGMVGGSYDLLVESLQSKLEVKPFPFDWRKSVFDSGRLLAEAVEKEVSAHHRTVHFLGHSMGGMVVRAMISQRRDLWNKLRQRGGRLVMLGTPENGTWMVPRVLLGRERFLRLLALADFAHEPEELSGVFRGFPGLLELLPSTAESDCFAPEWWRRQLAGDRFSGFKAPDSRMLAQAKRTRERLQTTLDPDGMLYIAGRAPLTPCGMTEGDNPDFMVTSEGDGWVSDATGRPVGLRAWRIEASHDQLANHPSAFPALVDLLEGGTTTRIDEMAGAPKISIPTNVTEDLEPLLFPAVDELAAACLGSPTVEAVDAGRKIDTINISVVHGDLRYSSFPVIVGHYLGDTIVSAEAAIDRQLGGRLTKRYRASLYPGGIGTAEVIHSPGTSPPGVLVVGLGEVGEITPEKVRRGVRAACLRHALLILENDPFLKTPGTNDRSWRSAAFSTLLLGTVGGNSLSIETAVAAIVQGAIQANHALKGQSMWDKVRIDRIEIVELHEDLAIAAIRGARGLERVPPAEIDDDERIEVSPPYLIAREGRLFHRPANQYSTGWWRRIQITGVPSLGRVGGVDLHFLTLTDRARAEDRLESMQRRLVDRLVSEAIESPAYDPDLCATLFELLIPNLLKDQSGIEAHLALVLDAESAQYPWELLAERAHGKVEPFALREGLIRQFKTPVFRQNPQSASEPNVLIVGDTESGEVELKGAQEEAKVVANVLNQAGYTSVTPLVRADALAVINALFATDYRILHLAGHGAYNATNPDESGMLLGDGIFLTAKELVKLRIVPDLVFLNCCHLARTDRPTRMLSGRPDRLAASVSQELIKMGVKAIVAAGWAVDDRAASTFAETFYQTMVDGLAFGDAVLRARQETAKRHPNVSTWGAYQCYGNPAFTLTNVHSQVTTSRAYYSRRELLDRMRSLAEAATTAGREGISGLCEELQSLVDLMPSQWIDGEMLSALGEAWGELHEFSRATDCYRRALLSPGAEATLRSAEQLANLLVREARALDKAQGSKARAKIKRLCGEATERLDWLLRLGPTVERLALYGSLSKRLAMMSNGQTRIRHLRRAEAHYRSATKLGGGSFDSLAALNLAACRWLAATGGTRSASPSLSRELQELIAQVEKRSTPPESTFWDRVASADALLLRSLLDGTLIEEKVWLGVREGYRLAIDRGATPRELASVVDNLEFLGAMLGGRRFEAARQAIARLKEEVEKR